MEWRRLWRERVRPMLQREERLRHGDPWGTIWLLKTYFAAVSVFGEGADRPHPHWSLIGALLNQASGTTAWSAARLRVGWARRARDFESWNGTAFLIGSCGAYMFFCAPGDPFREFLERLVDRLKSYDSIHVIRLHQSGCSATEISRVTLLMESEVERILSSRASPRAG